MAFDPDEWRLAEDFGTRRRPVDDLARFGWPLVAAVGLVLAVVGGLEFVVGPTDPTWGFSTSGAFGRTQLLFLVAFGLLVVALATRPLRDREAWSWLVLWLLPLVLVGSAALDMSVDGELWPAELVLAAVATAGLLVAARGVDWRRL